ncbi:MAG: DUF393 domain-containing protein [Planctomycetes bacterium]|nr:DUF393 domain-containing protein [Planctomycetota bacterium]
MSGLWRMFRDFWAKPVAPEPMAAFRIAIALILIFDLCCTLLPNLESYFGPLGVFEPGDARAWQENAALNKDAALPGIPQSIEQIPKTRWSFIGPDTPMSTIYVMAGALLICALCLLTGTLTRVATVGAWLILTSLHQRNPNLTNAGDVLLRISLFYLMLMPAGAAWSVDNIFRRKLGWKIRDTVAPWSMRLAQFQIAAVYFFSGVEKNAPLGGWLQARMQGSENPPYIGDWNNGLAIPWALRDALITRVDWFVWIPVEILYPFTLITLMWELTFPLLLLFAITRRWALAIGYAVHMGIFLTMEVNHFSFTTMAFYALFVPAAIWMDIAGRRTGEMSGEIEKPGPFADPAAIAAAKAQKQLGRTRFYRVFYDSLCPVCRRSVLWLRRLDWLGVLKFEDLHDREAAEAALPGVSYADQLKRLYVLRPDGQYFGGFAAVRAMAAVMPLLWPVLPLMWLPGAGWVGHKIYDVIATNRFRYAKCDDEMCSLHLKLVAGKQINDEVIAQVIALADKRKKAAIAKA